MADTQLIKKVIEPYIRGWLAGNFPGHTFSEKKVSLPNGVFNFDGVSEDGSIVAHFLSSRALTATGNENTGAVRKALVDVQFIKLASAPVRLVVFTDEAFRRKIEKRSSRVGIDGIEFLYCSLPEELRVQLDANLDACSKEQTDPKGWRASQAPSTSAP